MSLGHIKRYEVTITGFFGEDAEEDTFRVGSVTNVKLVGGADSEPGDIIKVNAIVGDTSTHEPLRERAEVKSSTQSTCLRKQGAVKLVYPLQWHQAAMTIPILTE